MPKEQKVKPLERPPKTEEKYRQAVGLFMQTDKLHRKLVEQQICGLGIHRSQHIMLMALAHFDRAVSQKELASKLQISTAAAAVSLRKLESGGYIGRISSKEDLRYNEVTITKKGLDIVNRSEEIFKGIDKIMTRGIDEAELSAFISTIKKMKANLKEAEN